jgi:hypothetical protein
VKAGQIVPGREFDRLRLFDDYRWTGGRGGWITNSVPHSLLRETVTRIEIYRGTEIGQGFDLLAGLQLRIAALNVVVNQLLPRDFAGSHIFNVSGYQVVGLLELLVGLVRVGFL